MSEIEKMLRDRVVRDLDFLKTSLLCLLESNPRPETQEALDTLVKLEEAINRKWRVVTDVPEPCLTGGDDEC